MRVDFKNFSISDEYYSPEKDIDMNNIKTCYLGLMPISMSSDFITIVGKRPKKQPEKDLPRNYFLITEPWFAVNDKKFQLGKTTFSDAVIDLIDYLPNDKSTDCSRNINPGEMVALNANDNHGLKISMRFKNTDKFTLMRDSSKLWQFIIEYAPDDELAEQAKFKSYIPFRITEDIWLKYTKKKPDVRMVLQDVRCYCYKLEERSIELWFDAKTKNLAVIIIENR